MHCLKTTGILCFPQLIFTTLALRRKLQTQSQTERLAENEFLDHGGAANENVHMPVQAVPIAVL